MLHQLPSAAPASQVEVAATCPDRNNRTCFPRDMTGNRGSDRLGDEPAIAWYRVQVGGRINGEFVFDSFNAQFETGGFFGNGLRDRITETAAAKFPGLDVLDFWPLTSPPIAA